MTGCSLSVCGFLYPHYDELERRTSSLGNFRTISIRQSSMLFLLNFILKDLTMDSIRKKMQSLKYETDELIRSIHDNEEVAREANDRSDRCDCDIRDYGKKITKMESDFEETAEKLQKATADLEEKKKQLQELEADLSAISRRVLLLEDELNKSEIKLAKATMDLAVESKRADKVVKVVNTLTSKAMNDEVEIENLRQGNVC